MKLITVLLLFCWGSLNSQISISLFDESLNIRSEGVELIHEMKPQFLDLLIDTVILELRRVEIFSPKYSPLNEFVFYRGRVSGYEKSSAAVSFINDEVIIVFSVDETIRVRPVEGAYKMYQDTQEPFLNCFVTEELILPQNQQQSLFAIGNCVEVYFECDFKSYQDNGSSVVNTEAWVASLFNEVATIYENENIPIVISDIMVWTVTDPYASLVSINAVLSEFVQQTSENGYDGRLAHLLTTRTLGGGIAFVNVLCSNTLACAVSANLSTNIVPFPNYSWNVNVVAHEMGHNFGSQHTHRCVWNGNNTQIDDCGSVIGDVQPCYDSQNPILPEDGTIMSYCHLIGGVGINFNLGFGPQPGALILSKYLTATCNTGNCPVLAIGIEQFDLRVQNCAVYLRWIADFPVLSESSDGETWQQINIEGNSHLDRSPSKFYRLQSEGHTRILTNHDLCAIPYWTVGSTLVINTPGYYRIAMIDGRVLFDGELSGEIKLSTGMWIVTFNNQSELIFIP